MHTPKAVLKILGLTLLLALTSGCGSRIMNRVATQPAPESDYALVTFVRPTVFGGAIMFGIWDSEEFVGILTAKSYIQHKTKPGEHIFLAQAENWSYVKANLQGGKHYFVIGRVFPGVWKARVALDPVRRNDPETSNGQLGGWLKDLEPTAVIADQVEAYRHPRLGHIKNALEDYQSGKVTFEVLEADDGLMLF